MFIFHPTDIDGLTLIEPKYVADSRGYMIKYFEKSLLQQGGIDFDCYEAMESCSAQGVLRGLHRQVQCPQAKLVRVVSGEIYDVGVDLRAGSPTFGRWYGCCLSGENRHMLYLPRGFAHGFLVLSPQAVFSYMCDAPYHPDDEQGISWNDPDLAIDWPLERVSTLILSEKDRSYRPFAEQLGFK